MIGKDNFDKVFTAGKGSYSVIGLRRAFNFLQAVWKDNPRQAVPDTVSAKEITGQRGYAFRDD